MTGRVVVNVRTLQAPRTGVQRYTAEVLDRLGDEVDRIAPARPAFGPVGHVWEQTALPRLVGDRLLWSPAGTGPWTLTRQVVTIHDAAPLDHPEWFDRKFAAWYRFLHPRLLESARAIITVSEFSRERLLEHVPAAEGRVAVIPLGTGSAFRPLPAADVEVVRRRLDLPERYLLVVGSLQPRKNLGRLLSAWRRVRDRLDGFVLAVSGVSFDAIFGDAGFEAVPAGVRLLGWVDDADLPALYSGAHAFVYPSLYEGFGLPPLEAMACGTPVVVADAGSLPEVVGAAAVRVDPHDIDDIAGGLVRVVEDEPLRERLTRDGLVQASGFTWERAADLTRSLLSEAVAVGA